MLGFLAEIDPRKCASSEGWIEVNRSTMLALRIGKSLLVERETLAELLGRLAAADDPACELASMRAQGKPAVT